MLSGKPIAVNFLPLLLLNLADAVFIYKYADRAFSSAWAFTLVYLLIKFSLPLWSATVYAVLKKWWWYVFFALLLVFCALVAYKIPLYSLHVDRWDAIVFWWDAFFDHQFPYISRTRWGNFPSPLPFLQLLYLPFYLLGDLCWSVPVVCLLFFLYLRKKGFSSAQICTIACWLGTSAAFMWEVCVRSTLLSNSLLMLVAIVAIADMSLEVNKKNIGTAILAGCVMSTRMIALLPLFMAFAFHFKQEKNLLKSSVLYTLTVLAFVLTFLPLFIWGHWGDFFIHNPMRHHNSYMPQWATLIFMATAVLAGWLSTSQKQVIWLSGTLLFVSACAYVLTEILRVGAYEMYFNNLGDISYPTLSFCFLLYCLPKADGNSPAFNSAA